jgi:hypothetical protein
MLLVQWIKLKFDPTTLTIGLDGNSVTAGGLDFFDGRFGGIFGSVRDVIDDDLVSLGTDFGGDRSPQSTRGTRHQDDLGVVGDHVQAAGGVGLGDAKACGGVLLDKGVRRRDDEGGGQGKEGTRRELHGFGCI